ncbi:MAG: hypothetical protein K6C40_03955 [Thermoguttaceae bacterium]|nr:hypothetical protein [Thermoguttaceae bacterium]
MSTPKPLHLKIEWNGQLKAGEHLSPKFLMTGDDLRKLESISCVLDRCLTQDCWESDPKESVKKENQGWSFTESLSLDPSDNSSLNGVFKIDFEAHFKIIQDCQLVTAEYKTTFFLEVNDEKLSEIDVETEGEDNVTWIKAPSGVSRIHIRTKGSGNSLGFVPDHQSQIKNEQNFENSCEVDLDPSFVQPILPSENNPFLFLLATLPDGQERYFQIAARQSVLIGRSRTARPAQNVKAADFVYRFYGTEENPDPVGLFLSSLISRNMLGMTLTENGLKLKNLGRKQVSFKLENNEFYLDQYNPPALVDLLNLQEPFNVKFANFSSLEFKKYSAPPEWNDRIEQKLHNYQYLRDLLRNPLWRLGTILGVNSIRLRRSLKHPVDFSTLQFLKQSIKEGVNAQEYPDASDDNPAWTTDFLASKEEFHFIVRMLSIGNDPIRDAICFDRHGMQTRHATLYFCDNHFGLINHSDTAIIYQQFGTQNKLYQDECLPLQPGIKFRIGRVNFHIFESFSNYLEVQRQEHQEPNQG